MRPEVNPWVIGLNHGSHDASCAIAFEGRVVAAIEEERLSRRKRAPHEFPVLALRQCLSHCGIELADAGEIVLGSDHAELAAWLGLDGSARDSVLPYGNIETIRALLLREFQTTCVPPIRSVKHHMAHAASAFWPSGFEQTAILVMDAMGEDTAGFLGVGQGPQIDVRRTLPIEHSLGFFYEAACLFAGLGKDDAGKLMGLAAYGRPRFDLPLRLVDGLPCWVGVRESRARGRALIEERVAILLEYFQEMCFPYAIGLRDDIMAYADFAASVQHALQSTVLGLLTDLQRRTGLRHVVMAGGVALNCTANGSAAESGVFDHFYVQPAAHDGGVSIGAAMLGSRDIGFLPEAMPHPYLAPDEDDAAIERVLSSGGWCYEHVEGEALAERTAQAIAQGEIVAWHQGNAEIGPRALGARSLLGDPRTRHTLVRLNTIKGREMWRPLAPSVLREHFDEFFVGRPNSAMLMAARVRPSKHAVIPAVVHVDGSARPQVVGSDQPPRYAALLHAFKRLTGIPMLVNTSLNLCDEPICNAAADTLALLSRSDVNRAVIGPYMVHK
jgi:carbamoyltransferase